jgi:hypothetical protein
MGAMERADDLTTAAREYLTFRLSQEEYGIDILKVQEIRGYEPPTRIANAPTFIKVSSICAALSCPSSICGSSSIVRKLSTTASQS